MSRGTETERQPADTTVMPRPIATMFIKVSWLHGMILTVGYVL